MADADTPPDAPHDGVGHRERLRERLFADPDGLLDHELVEYLLSLAYRRGDTKPLAKRLLAEFGSLPTLFAADADALQRVEGMGEISASAIRIVNAVMLKTLRAEAMARPVLSNWQALLDYLRADMAPLVNERFRVLHLNTRNMLIRDEVMSEGSIDQASVHVREVIRRAMDLGSAAIILVHNHPSGDPQPSKADIDITRALVEAAKRLGIAVHDHLIIGSTGHTSMKARGLI